MIDAYAYMIMHKIFSNSVSIVQDQEDFVQFHARFGNLSQNSPNFSTKFTKQGWSVHFLFLVGNAEVAKFAEKKKYKSIYS